MIRKTLTASIVAYVLTVSPAFSQSAPDWAVAELSKEAVYLIDHNSTRTSGVYIHVWMASVNSASSARPYGQQYVQAEKSLEEFDCNDRRDRTLSSTLYARDHSVIRTRSQPTDWHYTMPGSLGEARLLVACGSSPSLKLNRRLDPVSDMEVFMAFFKN